MDLDVVVEYSDAGDALIDALQPGSFGVTIRGSLNAGPASREIEISTQR